MPQARVRAVRSVVLAVTDLETATRFFTEVWNLEPAASTADAAFFRGTGAFHHILSIHRAPRAGMIRVVFDAADRATVDALYAQVQAAGRPADGAPRALPWPGGGYGFGFKDPEQRNFAVVCDVADRKDIADRPDRPRKISHANLNCADNEATFAFMRDALGFRLSDHANNFRFLRCNADHHSMVIGFNKDATLNHVAFEMPDLDSVMRGIGRMRDHGYPVEWGPGRHGPGNNAFAYFCGPEELPLEYTSEMQLVTEDHVARTPDDWKWPPGRVDQWGIVAGPTARVKRAQSLFRFSDDGYRLGG
ncbi:MAG: glyoxalase [Alphaproteobacteria bacterium]|nr:glyoxalase [Alphaproteobacteria bacterium]